MNIFKDYKADSENENVKDKKTKILDVKYMIKKIDNRVYHL